jgi:hypothetical protein
MCATPVKLSRSDSGDVDLQTPTQYPNPGIALPLNLLVGRRPFCPPEGI